jgi:DNA-binding beta-propeller fold protein YncE
MRINSVLGAVLALLALWVAGAVPAQASRALLDEELLLTSETKPIFPPPDGQVEGACGLAISPAASLYVSDYYHEVVHVFSTSGGYSGTPIKLPALGGVCGLAFASTGALYANEWHERVVRLQPTAQEFDEGNSTGVAVGPADRVYVNNRTHVSVYEPTGALAFTVGDKDSLGDGYGLAVDETGKVYVADGADNTVKVYDPAVKVDDPVLTIAGPPLKGFVSLVDTDVEIDPTNGHLLVVDNLKPGYEHPQAAVYEFDETGAFLGQLPGAPVFGEPSGLAVDPDDGKLFVTTGNDERSNVFLYGPYSTSLTESTPPSGGSEGGEGGFVAAAGTAPHPGVGGPTASISEVVQRRGIRVSFGGKLTPRSLPRHRAAPVGILVEAKIAAVGDEAAPQLRRLAIEINRNGHFSPQGLPTCLLDEIQPSTTAGALEACRHSLVGEGHFSASVRLPQQSPFPSEGKVLAFSGRIGGRPAILAHIYGTQPVPTSYVLSFLIRNAKGAYGTVLEASLPQATGEWGYVTGLRMSLRRVFSHRGRTRSYLTASCPAPPGFPSAVFPLARTSFAFAGGTTLISILNRSCKATG